MGDRIETPEDLNARLRRMHEACVEVLHKNRAFRSLVHSILQPESGSAEARRLFESLVEVKEASRRFSAALDGVRTEIRSVGIEQGWEHGTEGTVEPGMHLLMGRFVRTGFLEGVVGAAIADPRWQQQVRVEDFKDGGALNPSLYVTNSLRNSDERTLLALEREDRALRRALSSGRAGEAESASVGAPIVNHRLRRFAVPNGGESKKLTARQIDYVVLCALAKKQNAWYQTDDFKKHGGLGNPSELFRRLPDEVKRQIDVKKHGRRLLVDARIEEPVPLECGRVIDWKGLQVVDRTKLKP